MAANCYVNWLRVSDYREMFDREWPGCEYRMLGATEERRRELCVARVEARAELRRRGEGVALEVVDIETMGTDR